MVIATAFATNAIAYSMFQMQRLQFKGQILCLRFAYLLELKMETTTFYRMRVLFYTF